MPQATPHCNIGSTGAYSWLWGPLFFEHRLHTAEGLIWDLLGLRSKIFQNYFAFCWYLSYHKPTTHRCLLLSVKWAPEIVLYSNFVRDHDCVLPKCVALKKPVGDLFTVHLTFGAGRQHQRRHLTCLWARHTVGPVYR